MLGITSSRCLSAQASKSALASQYNLPLPSQAFLATRSALPLRLFAPGEPISTRWTQAVKQEIKQSRIAVTRQVVVCVPSTEIHAISAESQATFALAMLPAFFMLASL